MANDPGVEAFLQAWNALPQNYVPQWEFAYSENDGGLYAFPASEKSKTPYLVRQGQSFWGMPSEDPDPVTSQALATGQVPGAERIDAAGRYGSVAIDPKYSQDLGVWQQMIQAGNATQDEFSGPVANIFGNQFTLPAAFAGGMMGANAAGNLGVAAGQGGLRLTQNPTAGGAGGVAGSLASAATGIPGLSTVGSFLGNMGQQAFSGSGGTNNMAEDYSWLQALPQLLASGVGLAGSGISLAAMPEIFNRMETLYQQNQGNYQQQQQIAQTYQDLLDLYQQQQQQAYATQTQQAAEDRAARQEAYRVRAGETAQDRAGRLQAYEQRTAQQAQDRAKQQTVYQKQMEETDFSRAMDYDTWRDQVGEAAVDRANKARANVGREAIAARLSDPAQTMAGAEAMYQSQTRAEMDAVAREQSRQQALKGQAGGGGAMARANAESSAVRESQRRQQAMQNFMASQGAALNAYNPLTGSYTPDAPTLPTTPSMPPGIYTGEYPAGIYTPDYPTGQYAPDAPRPLAPANMPSAPNYIPGAPGGQASQQDTYKQLSNQMAQLGKLLAGGGTGMAAGTGGLIQLLSQLFSGGSGQGDPYGSAIPGMTEGYDPSGAQSYFDNLYSGSGLTGNDLEDFSYLNALTF